MGLQAGEQLVRVNQDTRLNYRVIDLRTPANQGIFRVQCQVENVSSSFELPFSISVDPLDRLFGPHDVAFYLKKGSILDFSLEKNAECFCVQESACDGNKCHPPPQSKG